MELFPGFPVESRASRTAPVRQGVSVRKATTSTGRITSSRTVRSFRPVPAAWQIADGTLKTSGRTGARPAGYWLVSAKLIGWTKRLHHSHRKGAAVRQFQSVPSTDAEWKRQGPIMWGRDWQLKRCAVDGNAFYGLTPEAVVRSGKKRLHVRKDCGNHGN